MSLHLIVYLFLSLISINSNIMLNYLTKYLDYKISNLFLPLIIIYYKDIF